MVSPIGPGLAREKKLTDFGADLRSFRCMLPCPGHAFMPTTSRLSRTHIHQPGQPYLKQCPGEAEELALSHLRHRGGNHRGENQQQQRQGRGRGAGAVPPEPQRGVIAGEGVSSSSGGHQERGVTQRGALQERGCQQQQEREQQEQGRERYQIREPASPVLLPVVAKCPQTYRKVYLPRPLVCPRCQASFPRPPRTRPVSLLLHAPLPPSPPPSLTERLSPPWSILAARPPASCDTVAGSCTACSASHSRTSECSPQGSRLLLGDRE